MVIPPEGAAVGSVTVKLRLLPSAAAADSTVTPASTVNRPDRAYSGSFSVARAPTQWPVGSALPFSLGAPLTVSRGPSGL